MKALTKKDRQTIERLVKQYTVEEIADAFMVPRETRSPGEEDTAIATFRAIREREIAARTPEQILEAKILQIKYQILSCIESDAPQDNRSFQHFMHEYIRAQGKKDKEFAEDVGVKPYVLSQYLNGHRNPPGEFLIRLEMHSDGLIPASWWFRLLQKPREAELMQNAVIRERERKHLKNKIEITL